jgi:O-antigen ligase
VFIPKLLEQGFAIFSLLFFSDAIFPLLNEGGTGSDRISQVLYYLIQVVTILLIVAWHKKIIPIVIKEKLLWIFVAFALVSVFWSAAPGATLSRDIGLVRVTLFGVYFTSRYTVNEQLQLLAWTFGIAALLSLVFAVALPSYGIMGMGSVMDAENLAHTGSWRGIYTHKNGLGRIMVLSAMVQLLVASSSRQYSWLAWVGFSLSVGLIVFSTSKTSLVIFLTIMLLIPLYRALRWNTSVVLPFFITLILVSGGVITVLVSNAEAILGTLGKDLTLTGRTDLWLVALEKIWERPWLGYGYYGFWQGMNGESADIWIALKWEVPHAHNGFLDVAIDLGFLGLLIFLIPFLAAWLRAIMWVRHIKTSEGLLPLGYLTFMVLSNLTESSIIRPNTFWILYVVITLSMHHESVYLVQFNASSHQKDKVDAMKQTKRKSKHTSTLKA